MLALGESGRFEFKRDADELKPGVFAALANSVALDPEREAAHLLVGVDEVEDEGTGLVSGTPVGLSKGLDRTVARLQDLIGRTRPIPVDAFIVEEAVADDRPFIRIEIRPSMPPHYDDEGRRQTRQGRSTRALTDDELLRIYLDREAGSFAARFRHAGEELRAAVGAVGSQVDDIAGAIDRQIAEPLSALVETAESAASSASAAESAADTVGYDVGNVERMVRDLRQLVEDLQDDSLEPLAARVVQQRRRIWWEFTADTWERNSEAAARLERALGAVLRCDVSLEAALNTWELRVWKDLFRDRERQRGGRGTLKWWVAAVKEVEAFMAGPAYSGPELPQLRAELQADLDAALNDPESQTRRFRSLLDS